MFYITTWLKISQRRQSLQPRFDPRISFQTTVAELPRTGLAHRSLNGPHYILPPYSQQTAPGRSRLANQFVRDSHHSTRLSKLGEPKLTAL